ncbi:hypothetical protein TNIN_420001 [Trichonephila inaurata madagascariensis]|uniref:Uncharacterized protein n=1 Tax=Trichonephila inaurata madagascariensis TaxID=2747483 RepID=A0A8X6JQS3_9ARAC|nr:hypothetical protein TNIN_420001 [Trichonephila inaurata madagascariensis]
MIIAPTTQNKFIVPHRPPSPPKGRYHPVENQCSTPFCNVRLHSKCPRSDLCRAGSKHHSGVKNTTSKGRCSHYEIIHGKVVNLNIL